MGVGEVSELRPGAHVCALYSGPEERDRLLVPFMREGLRNGDRCLCLIHEVEPASMRQRTHRPAGSSDLRGSEHLDVCPASHISSRADEFSVEQLTASLTATRAPSTDDEPPLLRAATEMSWEHDEPGASDLLVYESAVNQVLAELPAVILCMYDLQRSGGSLLVDVLRTHSKVLLDGTVLDNPHCLAPTDIPQRTPDAVKHYPLARPRNGRSDGPDQWLSLTAAEVRVAELVVSGMTNRAMAAELIVSRHTVDAHLKHIYVKLDIHSRVELTALALQHGQLLA